MGTEVCALQIQSDSKLLSGFPWSTIFKLDATI
jgi:hypothetical protein